jgi:WD40 repeat protein
VRIWDVATGNFTATLAGHSDEVNAVAWSPDGKLLASASDDGTVQLWDAQAHVPIKTVLEGGRGPIVSLAFSHDGGLLASGDDRGLVVLADTSAWHSAKTIETGGGRVDGRALSHGGNWLATATENAGIQVWSLRDTRPPKNFAADEPLRTRGRFRSSRSRPLLRLPLGLPLGLASWR